MSGPLVTIVTPSFNQGHFIAATIESVLSQDYPRIEYIVMDGGSTDSTSSVVKPYLNRLTFVSEKDSGQSHAINKGLRMAKGEIVAYLNSDDTLLPGAVSRAVAALNNHPDAGAIYGDGYQIDYHGNIKQRFPFTEPFNLWKLTFLNDYILQQSTFFRRACLEEIGWFREDLHFGMDWDILVRLGKRFGLAYVPESLGCLREYDEAKSFSGGATRFDELASILRSQSGKERPPGWWFYGGDTYDKIGSDRIRSSIPGPLGRYLAMRYFHLCRAFVDRAFYSSQGLAPGRWAAKTLHWMMPSCHRAVTIRGMIPDTLPSQSLRIYVNCHLATVHQPRPGPFEITVPIQPDAQLGAALLRIQASQTFLAPRIDGKPVPRRVAWQILAFDGIR